MKRGLPFYLIGAASLAALAALAGCGRGIQFGGEREAWRHEAEVECLKSGAVKPDGAVVQISPIEGPGMCGADFPLKVSGLGETPPAIGYSDEYRPPASIPGGPERWPITEQRYVPPAPAPRYVAPNSNYEPRYAPASASTSSAPMSIVPPGADSDGPQTYEPRGARPATQLAPGPSYLRAPDAQSQYAPQRAPQYEPAEADDIPDDAVLPDGNRAPPRQSYQPPYQPQREAPTLGPSLGPARGPAVTGAIKAAVTPAATLACPMVSALDAWVTEAVQPAAQKWFHQPVVQIKQISAYSCRGMVGNSTAHISEHAFGNALDVAGFVFADGRKLLVKTGWTGTPEETGFLHDVQLAACERFTTVLAPGYNVYHYDHIHLDLMRRASGRRACKPYAMTGEEAAVRMSKTKYARHDPNVTGAVGAKAVTKPLATPGADGDFADDDGGPTGSISKKPGQSQPQAVGDDGDFDDDE
jgi:hypothetical protein